MKKRLGTLLLGSTLFLMKHATALKQAEHSAACEALMAIFDLEEVKDCGQDGYDAAATFAKNWPIGSFPLNCGCGGTPPPPGEIPTYYLVWDFEDHDVDRDA